MSRYLKVSEEVYEKLRDREDVREIDQDDVVEMMADTSIEFYITKEFFSDSVPEEYKEKLMSKYKTDVINDMYEDPNIKKFSYTINDMDFDIMDKIEENLYCMIYENINMFNIRKQLENMDINIHNMSPFEHEDQIRDIEASMNDKISESLFKENSVEIFIKDEDDVIAIIKSDENYIAIARYLDSLRAFMNLPLRTVCITTEKLIEKEGQCISNLVGDNEHHKTIKDYIAILIILEKHTNFL